MDTASTQIYAEHAIINIQLLPSINKEARQNTLYNLLAMDKWWRELPVGVHIQIGRYISDHTDELRQSIIESGIEIRYPWTIMDGHVVFLNEKVKKTTYVYHYTSLGGALGILKNGNIRLMNSRYTNDRMELKSLANSVFLIAASETGKTEEVEELKERYFKSYDKESYFASFSKLRDDASQWERYGDYGRGVCLAFDEDELKSLTSIKKLGRYFKYQKVSYNPQSSKLKGIANNLSKYVLGSSKSKESTMLNNLFMESIWYKHESFKQEMEYRLITTKVSMESFSDVRKRELSQDGKSLREYIEFWFDGNVRSPGSEGWCNPASTSNVVKYAILGPKATCPKDVLERELGRHSLRVRIVESDCPLV